MLFYLLNLYHRFDLAGSDSSHDEEKLARFLDKIIGSGLALDGTLATDLSKMQVSHWLTALVFSCALYRHPAKRRCVNQATPLVTPEQALLTPSTHLSQTIAWFVKSRSKLCAPCLGCFR